MTKKTTQHQRLRRAVLVGLLLSVILLFHLIMMPKELYPGDPFAVRAACASLLNTGDPGFDYSMRQQVKGFTEERGQYFFENDSKQKLYSKYGFGNTFALVPPMLAEKLYRNGRPLSLMHGTSSLILFINIYQILLTLVAASYLYAICGLYTKRTWLKIFFVLASFYGTYVWHYLRGPALEIYLIACFSGCLYHTLSFIRARREDQAGQGPWLHLAAGALFAGVLITLKLFYVLVLGAIWLACGFAGPEGTKPLKRLWNNLSRHWWRYGLALGLPSFLVLCLLLYMNWFQFGSPLNTGYGQWHNKQGEVVAGWSLKIVPKVFYRLWIRPGNTNAFMHYPVFFFALFGIVRFFQRHRQEAVLLILIFAFQVCPLNAFRAWSGAWAYGPRLHLLALMAGSLPFLFTCKWLVETRHAAVKYIGIGVIVLTLAWSVRMQWYMNSLHYFAFYSARNFLNQVKDEQVQNYFNYAWHRGYVHRDMIAFRERGTPFPPLEMLRHRIRPSQQERIMSQLRYAMIRIAKPNFYFFE